MVAKLIIMSETTEIEESDGDSSGSTSEVGSSDSDDHLEGAVQPYQFEPYEETNEGEGLDESGSDSDNDADGGRTRNRDWCTCGNCEIMELARESVCCQEIERVHTKCQETDPISPCIVQHADFPAVCLNRGVLDTAYYQYRQQYTVDDSLKRDDEKYRHVAYRQLCRWCWRFLGKDVRRVLPSCAVLKIRATFPSPDGAYTGFLLR